MVCTASKSPSLITGKPGLNHIDFQPGELAGNFQFLAQVHGSAGTLLAIAERRVEDDDSIIFHMLFFVIPVFACFDNVGPQTQKQKTPPPIGSGVLKFS